MPRTGSQITICDLPVRFDTYRGCSHACRYCFANRKRDISTIESDESAISLENFINGQRSGSLAWCDWDIPIHFGGMSDPFQPIERTQKRTLVALKVLHKYKYPFVISTKNKMIAEEPYLSILKECNVVVQISAACSEYNQIEKGASTFEERLQAMKALSPYVRVIVRVQPYLPELFVSISKSQKEFADAGVYGITVEGMKYIKKKAGTIPLNGDNVYPAKLLREHFLRLRDIAHGLGMRFYSAENRLRNLGDNLCCCGVDGMGWKVNTGNLVHMIYDTGVVLFSPAQKSAEIGNLMADFKQKTLYREYGRCSTFEQLMQDAYKTKTELRPLIPEDML